LETQRFIIIIITGLRNTSAPFVVSEKAKIMLLFEEYQLLGYNTV
jgi:hypothetical protein